MASIAIAWLVADSAARRGIAPARAAIFVGLNPVVLFYAVSGAHNDLFAALLLVCGIALALRRRVAAAGGAVVAASGDQADGRPGAARSCWSAARRRRRAAIGAAVAMLVIGRTDAGPVRRAAASISCISISTDPLFDTAFSGPDRLAWALGTQITRACARACTRRRGSVALIASVGLARWRRDHGGRMGVAGLLGAIASLAPWYLVWVLPLAALGLSRALGLAALLVTAYLLAVHIPALGGVPWLSQAPASTRVTTTVANSAPGRRWRTDQRRLANHRQNAVVGVGSNGRATGLSELNRARPVSGSDGHKAAER